ncbi:MULTISPECIES: N-acetylglucosamine-6-phosphate deacetylase [unclassified Halanaerobium]|uniref:N-acetylglucosamine-6-phosphate deacetylase n=1 Tax=unclassified Halanaerobium TaxID=2641197 RepID=UPI000DF1F510|nr:MULTISPECIES: N-acetylglucosamine-6-phosphate deacetylase [unclassified Halanaerobium]RCW50648.1 N-acetylglucosamine 6-phosphate deacetylase [Halanaerobium sp. MA284_MarDTE_T2]RCW86816.1 N-acetylglucosamine 6-phosphate deacetylase [Halanaerobium sp. DL-01]
MRKKLIKNINIITNDKIICGGSIVFGEKIEKIVPYILEDSSDLEVIDGKGAYLSAGFIDIHTHGASGRDTMEADYNALNSISKTLAKHGVTAFLPTTMTMSPDQIKRALSAVREAADRGTDGAVIAGSHVEGPFISEEYIGAQNSRYILDPDPDLLRDYYDVIKIVTLAPEKKGALTLIKELKKNNITAAAGHSAANYEDFQAAREAGMDHFTHLYNAMSGLHHRRPGLVGAALDSDLTVELIADLIHHHEAVDRLTIKYKGADRVILVSDSMEAAGLEDGKYELGGQEVFVKEGAARLKSGQLAGSVLTLDKAVRNVMSITDLSIPEIFRMVTLNPAKKLGIDHQTGRIEKNYFSDLILLNKKFEVLKTFIRGKTL